MIILHKNANKCGKTSLSIELYITYICYNAFIVAWHAQLFKDNIMPLFSLFLIEWVVFEHKYNVTIYCHCNI